LKTTLIASAVLAAVGALAPGLAGANDAMYDSSVSTTTKIGGSSVTMNGTLDDNGIFAEPWVTQLYAQASECLRLAVTTTNFDSELVVAAPNGTVYRDDDSGGSLRPLVRIANAPSTGWYTVQVASFSGAPTNANFTLKYARYNLGNPNCATSTTPLSVPHGVVEPAKVAAPAGR